jgi:hypothetical protein
LKTLTPKSDRAQRKSNQVGYFNPRTTLSGQQDHPGATTVTLTDGGRPCAAAEFGVFFGTQDNILGAHRFASDGVMTEKA